MGGCGCLSHFLWTRRQMPTYEVAYGVRLLDDVHNYFPALLYSQGRFMSTNQILHYIRYQIMTQFPRHGRIMPLSRAVDESLASAEFILNLLNTFVVHDDGRAAAFAAPVIVRATPAQINEGSEIVTDISGSNCAVCQDVIVEADTCRRLRACRHIYHQTCIDQWYRRSVRCPTCRHDIREAADTLAVSPM